MSESNMRPFIEIFHRAVADDFHRWHPGFTHCSPDVEELAAAAQPSHSFSR